MFNEVINQNNQSLLRKAENHLLLPARYLFKGHTIKIIDATVVWDAPSFNEKGWSKLNKKEKAVKCFKVAVAVALLIPSLILGVVAKGLNFLSKGYRDDFGLSISYLKGRELVNKVDGSFPDHKKVFDEKFNQIWDQIEDETIWKNPKFINEVSEAMDIGHKYMIAYFQDLTKEVGTDAKVKAQRLIIQPQNQKESGKQDFSHSFFLLSKLYHLARGVGAPLNREEYAGPWGIEPNEKMPVYPKLKLTLEDQESYFNPTKPQFHWRRIYNDFCAMVDKDNLRTHLESRGGDDRYSKWSKPDHNLVDTYQDPGTRPT